MSSQAQTELLSAYLDGELGPEERERIERLLERDAEVRQRYEGMRRVVSGLGHLERMAPPPTLGQAVTRRVALEGEHRSLLDRVEDGLSHFQRQPTTFFMFALVFALALIVFFFAWGLEKHLQDPPIVPVMITDGDQVKVAERVFALAEPGLWVQEGIDPEAPARPLDLDSDEGRRLLAEHPELHQIAIVLRHAHLELDGEVRELRVVDDDVHPVLPPD